MEYTATATATAMGLTKSGEKVTASASASASSNISYEDAVQQATNIAFQIAQSDLQTTTDVIEQTITIIENDTLVDIDKFSIYSHFNSTSELNNFQLTQPSTSSPYYYSIQNNKSNATYTSLGSGINGPITSIAIDSNNNVYVGGQFNSSGSFPVNNIAKWNGSTWSSLSIGLNAAVACLAIDSDDNLYAGGNFGYAGGVSARHIAKWNPNTETWSALGDGINNLVASIAFDSNDNVYVGGTFTQAGGVSVNNIAKWNGTEWSTLGTGITYDIVGGVRSIVVDSYDNVYAGGSFTIAGNVAVNNIAKWNPLTNEWSTLGSGFNNIVTSLVIDPNDNIYAGGYFGTAVNSTGSISVNRVAKWDGNMWSALGNGIGGIVVSLALDLSNNLYAGGNFATAGTSRAIDIAKWNGVEWSELGDGTNQVVAAIKVDSNNNIYAGGSFTAAGGLPINNIVQINYDNIYIKNINGSTLYLKYNGIDSRTNLLFYNENINLYSQIN